MRLYEPLNVTTSVVFAPHASLTVLLDGVSLGSPPVAPFSLPIGHYLMDVTGSGEPARYELMVLDPTSLSISVLAVRSNMTDRTAGLRAGLPRSYPRHDRAFPVDERADGSVLVSTNAAVSLDVWRRDDRNDLETTVARVRATRPGLWLSSLMSVPRGHARYSVRALVVSGTVMLPAAPIALTFDTPLVVGG